MITIIDNVVKQLLTSAQEYINNNKFEAQFEVDMDTMELSVTCSNPNIFSINKKIGYLEAKLDN